MADETVVRGKHHKLKRIVQKKAKVGLNTSGSVSYYKKVKAALNASLNSSRVRKSLAANNRALAQSLQQVKQELRNAYNEIAHLKVENQEMTIRLMRSEQLQSGSGEQAILEQRLQSLRSLLHEMSRHLLDVGTCLNDGIDLCLLTPRTSQGSNDTLPPSCPGDLMLTESRKSNELDAAAAKDVDSVLTESGEPEITSVFSNMGYGVPSTKAVVLPDMSIIMEQSLIDVDEDANPESVQMDTVFEEVTTPATSGAKNVLTEKTKRTTDSKLPQRVLITCTSKSDLNDKPFSGKQMLVAKDNQITSSTNDKQADSAGKACRRGTFSLSSANVGRRETFVISKDALSLALEGENGEGIDSVEMPDLVSDGLFSDEDCRPTCKEGANSEGKQSTALQLIESNRAIKTVEPLNGRKMLNVTNKEMNKENSQGKAMKHFSKFKKPTAPVSQCTQKVKDSSFFITNPCALNLVHQRVTGSKDGCLDSDVDSFTTVCASSSSSSFVEEIKASNRISDKLASIISFPGDKKNASDGIQCLPSRTENQNQGISDKLEPEISDCTMYFNTDMEFTEIIPQVLSLEATPEEITEEKSAKNVSTNLETENAKKGVDDENVTQEVASKAKSGIKPSETSSNQDSIYNSRHTSRTDDKKIPVALRVSKPGQMVFAVSRKEEDGSRKAIPAKLSTKARSKSKKEIDEMKKHLSAEEPKTVFDFHDKTPQHKSDKSKAANSIFDLSVGESVPTSVPSLASVREKLKTLGRELGISVVGQDLPESTEEPLSSSTKSEQELNKKPKVTTLLGDAPEYRLPLKMDNSPYLVKNKSGGGCSRPRSCSRGRDSQSRSKSRSRSRKDKVAGKEEDVERIAGESRTAEAESSAAEIQEPSTSGSRMRGRSRSRHRKSSDQCQPAPVDTENPLEPRRSARSKNSIRKRYVEEDSTSNLDDSLNMDSAKESVKNQDRVCGGGKKHDEDSDNPIFAKNKSSKQRGRSRSRHKIEKHGIADQVHSANTMCNNSASDGDLEGREAESQACRSNKIKSQKNGDDVCDKAQSTVCAVNAGASEGTKNISAQVSTSLKDVVAGGTAKMVERRHRSKSRHKKLPDESDYVEVLPCTSNKEVDILVGGSTKMTERQHRSKNKHRKLPDESENVEEAPLFISTKDVDAGWSKY
ncbi:uncharacterized protein LOC112563537 isoform X2 [Pomacea canaliculata]|uniref:uncharacterized protein LOC112563537 isoform X2 n=1 Tax=Pomacea canaliculata TaxID=400727 RepID=UPI000D72ECAA|nr:uncharacterized protein LOC112563537 isoform X2 [Pomacea canaliculata]